MSISGEKLKDEGKKNASNKPSYIYESHIKKRTLSVIIVTASQFSTLNKLIGMCKPNFAVCMNFESRFFLSDV